MLFTNDPDHMHVYINTLGIELNMGIEWYLSLLLIISVHVQCGRPFHPIRLNIHVPVWTCTLHIKSIHMLYRLLLCNTHMYMHVYGIHVHVRTRSSLHPRTCTSASNHVHLCMPTCTVQGPVRCTHVKGTCT